jgi:uncharacterized protein YcfJ
MNMNKVLKTVLVIAATAIANQVAAQVVFYENEGYSGRTFTTERQVRNFQEYGFNDRASSVVVMRDRWEVCEDVRFGGRCTVLRPGRYPSLAAMGLNDRVSSVRTVSQNAQVNNDRYAPPTAPVYDNRRRNNERLFQANITSARAVVGPPERRCWIEREQVMQDRGNNNNNVPGAIVGAIIGGVIGHQVGGGRGQDIATAGGAVAGAAVGSNVGRDGRRQQPYEQNVERCVTEPTRAPPEYWDVTYNFRGIEHRIQMTTQPGATITVNRQGEPRA